MLTGLRSGRLSKFMGDARNATLWTSLAALALLSGAVGLEWLRGFDEWSLRAAQSDASERLDAAGTAFSMLGSVEVSGAALIAISTGLALRGKGALAGRVLIAFLSTGILELAMKFLLPQTPVPESVTRSPDPTPLAEVATPFPYPSGHMLRAVIVFGALFVLWENRPARAIIALALAGMAASRVYLGVHWVSDVIGGALLGVAGLAWAFKKQSAISGQKSAKS